MGYGTRAMELLQQYYEGKQPSLSEDTVPDEENTITNVAEEVCI